MAQQWTFKQKAGTSYAVVVVLTILIAVVAVLALRAVVAAKDQVIDVEAHLLIEAQRLYALREAKGSEGRGFLLTGDERFLSQMQDARNSLQSTLQRLRQDVPTVEGKRLVDAIVEAEAAHQRAVDNVIALRRAGGQTDVVARAFDAQVRQPRDRLDASLQAFVAREEQRLQTGRQAATDAADRATTLLIALSTIMVVGTIAAGIVLIRSLSHQIGTAVGQVQSSSAELQAASTQQATGAKQQAIAMTEIATTISELLTTSRQITGSAQRVAQIAGDTAAGARAGDETVDLASASIVAIRRQVDMIVTHMLELGKKSQQIGSVLEIVSELAEQTNILAINATIEAAGAGEFGKRFGVVADEIRKLADRVTGSTKEIRALIEDVRSSVNTTVMATETGSKAVDAGSRQFGQLTTSFKQIVSLVNTTTEAAKEIELSIKQQMTAVEQVNVAIANIAQAAKETEASTVQTQQTASQLALLSKDLLKVIRPEAAA